jgi:hypothetical protein
MSTSKKASASSKTAHVMNLLSKSNTPAAEEPTAAPEEAQAPAPAAPAPAPNKPPIIVSLATDAEVSEQIRDALESALETDGTDAPVSHVPPEETAVAEAPGAEDPAEPAAEPVPEAAEEVPDEPVAEEAAAQEVPDEPVAEETAAQEVPDEPVAEETAAQEVPDEPVAEETAAQEVPDEPVVEETAAQGIPDEPVAEKIPAEPPAETATDAPVPEMPAPLTTAAPDSPITCVNVMQVLVDENADKYVKMFGLCRCPHCMADVKALALNNLQPKYVVMENGHVVPRISVYEGRYQAAVTAQILRACTTVMEQPRHEQPV